MRLFNPVARDAFIYPAFAGDMSALGALACTCKRLSDEIAEFVHRNFTSTPFTLRMRVPCTFTLMVSVALGATYLAGVRSMPYDFLAGSTFDARDVLRPAYLDADRDDYYDPYVQFVALGELEQEDDELADMYGQNAGRAFSAEDDSTAVLKHLHEPFEADGVFGEHSFYNRVVCATPASGDVRGGFWVVLRPVRFGTLFEMHFAQHADGTYALTDVTASDGLTLENAAPHDHVFPLPFEMGDALALEDKVYAMCAHTFMATHPDADELNHESLICKVMKMVPLVRTADDMRALTLALARCVFYDDVDSTVCSSMELYTDDDDVLPVMNVL